jgi:hypothetical protein
MKKIALQFIVFLMLIAGGANAQNLIAVQNGGNPEFYIKLDSAIVHAQNGDTIYIPGGIFPLTITINKMLHLMGVGYHADSTIATKYTFISGNLTINSNGSNGSITGVSLSGSINSDINVINYLVKRCDFNYLS